MYFINLSDRQLSDLKTLLSKKVAEGDIHITEYKKYHKILERLYTAKKI